jgi:hypothetical protein
MSASASALFHEAVARIDAANAEDPNQELFQSVACPKELLYARRMTAWLEKLEPEASEPLRLAARAQHIRRWTIPRDRYPLDLAGYKQWRTTLAGFHAETAGRILEEVGYSEQTIRRVQALLRKEKLKLDPEAQLLEDVICLVFLESYFADFARRHEEAKLVGILRKTWKKMSPRGRQAALGLDLDRELRAVVEKAVREA